MKRIAAAFLLCLLAQPHARAAEPDALLPPSPQRVHGNTLTDAVRLEAARLALSVPKSERRVQPDQGSKSGNRHNWCRRHLVGCGALIGVPAGIVLVWKRPISDFQQTGTVAVVFGAPIGAGIGAAGGGLIWAYTEP